MGWLVDSDCEQVERQTCQAGTQAGLLIKITS